MTETKTNGPRLHQKPCFCDLCWYITLDDMIDERAILLRAALADDLYKDGLERYMADEAMEAIPVARRLEALEHLLTWSPARSRCISTLGQWRPAAAMIPTSLGRRTRTPRLRRSSLKPTGPGM